MAVLFVFSVPHKGLVSFKFCIILNLLKQLKAGVSEEILKWHSHSLSPELLSFFCQLLASVCLGNKNGFKTKTKTMPVKKLFRYISFKSDFCSTKAKHNSPMSV